MEHAAQSVVQACVVFMVLEPLLEQRNGLDLARCQQLANGLVPEFRRKTLTAQRTPPGLKW
jgi:hypothetical protein